MNTYHKIFLSLLLLIFMMGVVSANDVDDIITNDIHDGTDLNDNVALESEVNNVKVIYVNESGDDFNTGTANNPYKTIDRAISDISEPDNTTIYLSEGTFGSYDDCNFNINFNHQYNDANLKIIGAGADKTFFDGQQAFNFATFGKETNVLLKDISFINCKGNVGGAIQSTGILNIENCIFKNCYSTSNTGGAISSGMDENWYDTTQYLSVKNSQFISCSVNSNQGDNENRGGGAIFAGCLSEFILDNNTFINTQISEGESKGVGVLIWETPSKITNNKFINMSGHRYDAGLYLDAGASNPIDIINNTFINCNNPSKLYSIVYLGFNGYDSLKNNTFINSTNSVGNYFATDFYSFDLNLIIDSSVFNVGNNEINNGVVIPINITDDMGNKFSFASWASFNINLINENNSYTINSRYTDGSAKLIFSQIPKNGIYNLSVTYGIIHDLITTELLTTVNVSASEDCIELYVSPKGSDANSGTKEFPFETIQCAIDVGFENKNWVIIHLLKGTYSGVGNVELSIDNMGSLQIIGESYNETEIDGNNTNWFLSVSSTVTTIENVSFINGRYKSNGMSAKHLISGNNHLTLKNCIFDNNTVTHNDIICYTITNTLFDNLVYTNNFGRINVNYDSIVINNSYFANNEYHSLSLGGIIQIKANDIIIENSKFINNTATKGGVIYSLLTFTSRNNYYANNHANQIYKERSDKLETACNGVIYGRGIFENDVFENNYGYYSGVGSGKFINCNFINNSAVEGGVIRAKSVDFTNCRFISNSADYGGVISLLPSEKGQTIFGLDNATLEGNVAKYNGNDIYLSPKDNQWDNSDYYPIDLIINFNNLNTSSLNEDLFACVTSSYDAKIGGGVVYFLLDGNKIGSAGIVNGVVSFNYAGFEEGQYNLSGYLEYQSDGTVVHDATVNVDFENLLDNITVWVAADGSDEDGNGSDVNPFKSITNAIKQASKNCRNITINVGEGIFTGDLNTALSLSSMNNITIVGAGIGKTIIDGENTTYFATITDGKNRVVISKLTIQNMLPDNRESREISGFVPMTINEGANLMLDSVAVVNIHGGEEIILNNGNLTIKNSQFRRNGFTTNGIIYGNGDLIIDNSLFEDIYVISSDMGLISANNLIINNSEIKNGYHLFDNKWVSTFDLINGGTNCQNYVTIENTKIANDGSIEALTALGVNTNGKLVNPALNINGEVYMKNCYMVNNYNGTVTTDSDVISITFPSAFGFAYNIERNVSVYNSSFVNYDYLWMAAATYRVHNFIFDGCLFENMEYVAWIRANNPESNYNITNSVFVNCRPMINQIHYDQMPTPQHVGMDNNYWCDNEKTIVQFLSNNGIKEDVVDPATWIILTSENGLAVFQLTDGENVTDYEGSLPATVSYVVDENGEVIQVLNINGDGYKLTVDENGTVTVNTTDVMKNIVPKFPADETVFANDTAFLITAGSNFTAVFTDKWGDPLKDTNVTIFIGEEPVTATTDENGTATFKVTQGLGQYTVNVTNPVTLESILRTISVTTDETLFASDVSLKLGDDAEFSAKFTDEFGKALANTTVTFKVGGEQINATTDENGTATFKVTQGLGIHTVTVTNPVTGEVITKTVTVTAKSTIDDSANKTQFITKVGDNTKFSAAFTDEFGNALANVTVTFIIGETEVNATTDANGVASVELRLDAGNYNITVINTVTGESFTRSATVDKTETAVPVTTELTATAKITTTYETSKKIVITLKDAKGNAIANAKVTVVLNGVTKNIYTGADGKASFAIPTNLAPKNYYTAAITYAGDDTHIKSSASTKIVVNKATAKITASKKTFKVKTKTKKYVITLKDNKGKAMKKAKVTLTTKVKGKTVKLTVKTKNNGKATFNLKKLVKGKYTASVKFAGNKNFKAATKKVKITVKK